MATKRSMPARRKERQREIPDPPVPAPPKRKGKRGAGVETLRRSKEPLGPGRKVKGA